VKRFELVRFSDGEVLVDYRSGAFFRVHGRKNRKWSELVAAEARMAEAPHRLLAQGIYLLHASAVNESAGVVAFCGASGAGKTTLARGQECIAEDLLVLEGTDVLVEAEARLRQWAHKGGPLRARSLLAHCTRRPLLSIAFLDAARRKGRRLRLAPLAPSEAFARLLTHSFAESGQPRIWRHIVAASRELARKVPCADATAPLL
jgi:hypothetical protein